MVVAISFFRKFCGQDTYVVICKDIYSAFENLGHALGYKDCLFISTSMKAIFCRADSNDDMIDIKSVEVLR